MKKLTNIILLFFAFFTAFSQSKKKKDIDAIKSMCGCFEIEFNFAETFVLSNNEDYQKSKIYKAKALEWGQLVEDSKDKISIQHLLIVGSKQFPTVIKHWRQDWIYQNVDLYRFFKENTWNYVELDKSAAKKAWTQKVYQVDDSPRYEGSARWVHNNDKSYWENFTYAPLPRREYTKRSDYNVMLRGNRHEIISGGWIHDQDNKKIIRSNSEDEPIAYEKGFSTYTKVDDERCIAAVKWWDKNKLKWKSIRSHWDEIYALKSTLELNETVDGKRLYTLLFNPSLSDEKETKQIIKSFIKNKK